MLIVGGEEYQLDQLKAAKFLTLEGVSTGEAIEVLEFRHLAEKNLEEKEVCPWQYGLYFGTARIGNTCTQEKASRYLGTVKSWNLS